jgi:hypothetical protein
MPPAFGIQSVTDQRKFAVASMEIYDELDGDPVVTDHGNGWYDILANSWNRGTFYPDRSGISHLEFLPEIGLCCRPFINPSNTLITQYVTSTSTGTPWAQREPTSGAYRVSRLFQCDATPGCTYRAQSTWYHPENPHFAFSLIVEETPNNWPTGPTNEPYVQVTLGSDEWAIRQDKQGTRLMYNMGGVWMSVQDINTPSNGGYNDLDEQWFIVRCMRNSICISTDFGKSYSIFKFPDELTTGIRGGKLKVEGRGGKIAFGVHQVLYLSGDWMSSRHNTFTSRLTGSPTFTSRKDELYGTSVTLTDLSSAQDAYMRYRLTFNPVPLPAIPFRFYTTPVYYATRAVFPITATIPTNALATPYDSYLRAIDIDKPVSLEESKCTVHVDLPSSIDLEGNFRWRKVRVHLGHIDWDGNVEYPYYFSGYIESIDVEGATEFGQNTVTFTILNHSIRFRRTTWWPTDVVPLGGLTVNEALDYILYTEGIPLNTSYRDWHTDGDLWEMPWGLPEDPFELIRPEESKWETMKRIASYMQLELVVTDDGVLATVPMDYVSGSVDHVYTTKMATDIRNQASHYSNSVNYGDSYTAVAVTAESETGGSIMAWAVDILAETSVASGRACPWREGIQERVQGTTAPWVLLQRAQALASNNFIIKSEPEVTAPVDIRLSRRMRIELNGASSVGIPEGSNLVLLTLRHSYRSKDGLGKLTTSAGMQLL